MKFLEKYNFKLYRKNLILNDIEKNTFKENQSYLRNLSKPKCQTKKEEF